MSANAIRISRSLLQSRYQSLLFFFSLSHRSTRRRRRRWRAKSGKVLFSCAVTSAASAYNRRVTGQADEISLCSRRRAVNGAFFGRNAEFSAASLFGRRARDPRAPFLHDTTSRRKHPQARILRRFTSPRPQVRSTASPIRIKFRICARSRSVRFRLSDK